MLPSLSSACTNSLSRIFTADYLLPRSDKTRYAQDFFLLRIKDFNCFLLRDPVNFNCFLSPFNWVNTQIRSLIKVLKIIEVWKHRNCIIWKRLSRTLVPISNKDTDTDQPYLISRLICIPVICLWHKQVSPVDHC